MKNAIIYSVHCDEKFLEDCYVIHQLKTSIKTLRHFNKNINVKVYISPSSIADQEIVGLDKTNLEIVPFDVDWDRRMTHEHWAKWSVHKWPNSFDALEKFKLDNIMYIDSDTFYQKDPEYLFDKYGNTGSIYGTPDQTLRFLEAFNVKNGGMNDGMFIMNKSIIPFKDKLLKFRLDYTYNLQELHKDNPDEEIKYAAVQWASTQYGIPEYLLQIHNPLKHIEEKDLHSLFHIEEWIGSKKELRDEYTIVHYLNYNTMYFDKKAHKVYEQKHGPRRITPREDFVLPNILKIVDNHA